MTLPPERSRVTDSVTWKLGKKTFKDWTRTLRQNNRITDHVGARLRGPNVKATANEQVLPKDNVHVVLRGPDGEIKYEEIGSNLITDHGDEMIAKRMYDDAQEIVTGMKLGTGNTAASKNGAGATLVTYISGSQEALDATASPSDKGAGSGYRITYICTWDAGDVTNGAIAEVVLTDQTSLADNAGSASDKVARYVFGATIDKQAGDSLEVTWQVDHQGS